MLVHVTNDLIEVVEKITCSIYKSECVYRDCVECRDKTLPMSLKDEYKSSGMCGKRIVDCVQMNTT